MEMGVEEMTEKGEEKLTDGKNWRCDKSHDMAGTTWTNLIPKKERISFSLLSLSDIIDQMKEERESSILTTAQPFQG